ncbi:MAG TPA: hypothetical protein VE979_10505 [Streptosporangiaceae bacterium]|nr:hypothetical protein [Streptosporangiaceae bacterium]
MPDSVRRLPRWGLACGLALLAACSSAPAVNTGPFGGGGDSSSLCVPVGRGGVLSYGLNAFTNTGGTARIERVALTDPHDLRIVAAYVVPVTGNTLYGVLSGYPPARGLPADVQWDRRQRANGAAIPHSRGIQYNLVLVLKPAGTKGTARSVDVFYRAAGQDYHLQTTTRIEVLAGPACA